MHIDFQRRSAPPRAAVLLALPLATAALGIGLYQYGIARATTQLQQARLLSDAQHMASQTRPTDAAPIQPARIEAVNAATAALNLPWDRLFASVEQSLDEDVALLSIQPEPDRRQLHLGIEAKDAHAMLDYVARLGSTPSLRNAVLKSHEIDDQNPYKPYRFQVDVEWLERKP
ncbi:hypothetical protein [Ralstonia solanacearum]|uniref:hypothetical protein n=1 Tax=Ralstonia solanacearum TaxID=305 RepID=UPI0006DC0E42|nr:hypothetical protein [Ralstonia solanacearum]